MNVFDRQTTRRALKAWHRPAELARHPFSNLQIVQAVLRPDPTPSSVAATAVALRQVLRQALDSLQPDNGKPDPADRRWWGYFILTGQYVDGKSPEYIARQLFIERTALFKEQGRALDQLAATLLEWEQAGRLPESASVEHLYRPGPPFLAPPYPPLSLVGRDALLTALKAHLLAAQPPRSVGLSGLPGVGKTSIAIALAHDVDVLRRYHDGVLWAALGPSPNVQAALAAWAAGLGLSSSDLAHRSGIDDLAGLVHRAIGQRHMLLVVDDAWSAADALAFRLGGPNCGHIVTSRSADIAFDFAGEHAIRVSELGETDALSLLTRFNAHAVSTHPDDVARLAKELGGLPLALTLAGRRLRSIGRGATARVKRALAALAEPANAESLAGVIGASVAALAEPARQALYTLAVFPPKPSTFSEEAAIAVAGPLLDSLDQLVDLGLVEAAEGDRYAIHQTIVQYCRMQAPVPNAEACLVETMADLCEAHARHYSKLDLERQNIAAALDTAERRQMWPHIVRIANAVYGYLEARGSDALAESWLTRAQTAAQVTHDLPGLGRALVSLSRIALKRGVLLRAETHAIAALGIGREAGDAALTGAALQALGSVADARARYAEARAYFEQGLSLSRQAGDREHACVLLLHLASLAEQFGHFGEAEQLAREVVLLAQDLADADKTCSARALLGLVCVKQGKTAEGLAHLAEGLDLAREIGRSDTIATALLALGLGVARFGDFVQADAMLAQGLQLATDIGYRRLITLLSSARCYLETGRANFVAANDQLRQALGSAAQTGHQWDLAFVFETMGHLREAEGDTNSAADAYGECQRISELHGFRELLGYARYRLARIAEGRGDVASAQRLGAAALQELTEIGYWEAGEVRAWLVGLGERTEARS